MHSDFLAHYASEPFLLDGPHKVAVQWCRKPDATGLPPSTGGLTRRIHKWRHQSGKYSRPQPD
jgi:hypothetical protein